MTTLFSFDAYNQCFDDLVAPFGATIPEYFTYHKRRYAELFSQMASALWPYQHPRVLEVGVSAFLPIYKRLFADICLITLDRPSERHGMTADFCIGQCGAAYHYNLDLNTALPSLDWGEPPLGLFDYILFTEVIEHLVANPVDVVGSLIGLLKPTGHLYLTTPNFLSRYHMECMSHGKNALFAPPRPGSDHDAAHHYHEFTLDELVQIVDSAGGHVIEAQFSDCWDEPQLYPLLAQFPEQRRNLVLLIGAGRTDLPRKVVSMLDKTYLHLHDEHAQTVARYEDEISQLRALIAGYERGRFIRMMKLLKSWHTNRR